MLFLESAAGTGKIPPVGHGSRGAQERAGSPHYFDANPQWKPAKRSRFLPGDSNKDHALSKTAYDALREMLEPEEMERALSRQTLKWRPLAYMRGRTLNNAFVILDEAKTQPPNRCSCCYANRFEFQMRGDR